jgi:transposase-like protein
MLPAIRQHARIAFRHYDPEAREEAVQAVVCNACCAVARLAELNKLDLCYASVLARFGVAQVKDGRMTGGRLNCKDVLSRYCQRLKDVVVERLDKFNEQDDCWEEAVVQDTRNSPVPDIVAFRCDFADWLKSLKRRDRRIAEFLSLGNRTSDTSRKFGVSAGRVSQLRRELAESWKAFTGECDTDSDDHQAA